MMNKLYLYLTTCLLLISACSESSTNSNDSESGQLIILNEGAFGQGNASLTTYDPTTRELRQNAFASRNSPRLLGDVLQSALLHDDELYLVVNNSKKIEVTDAKTLTSKSTINFQGAASPRYMAITSDGKGFVTSLFTEYIYEVDLTTASVTDSIMIGAGSEGILYQNDRLFVARNLNLDFSTASGVAVVNPSTGAVESVLETLPGPQRMIFDGTSIWVNNAGVWGENNGGLTQIDPVNKRVAQQVPFDASTSGLTFSPETSTLYVLSGGIQRMSTSSPDQRTTISDRSFYAISVYHDDEDIVYASDAKNFAQNGTVYMYKNDGVVTDSIQVGIAPRDVIYLKN
ncbi:MAG: hypothetical protein LAT57_02705 [Balneolales bacterium]|nr:hypothetical protein [Balneolales bacterium]